MKLYKFAILAILAVSSLLLGACTANTQTAHKTSTAFGLFSYEPNSFKVSPATTAVVRTDEISGMELATGDRLELFWGLITIQDYQNLFWRTLFAKKFVTAKRRQWSWT